MITTANYLLIAKVGDLQYFFEYDTCDIWETLEQFWHEDYPDTLIQINDGGMFPIDVLALEDGKEIDRYPMQFNAAVFHAFFDHGHKADGIYTLEQFGKDIERKSNTSKDIIVLWSDWCMDYDDEDHWLDYMVKHPKGHCNRNHLQEKWDYSYSKYGNKAAMTMFWRDLDNDNREILTEYITTQWHKQ